MFKIETRGSSNTLSIDLENLNCVSFSYVMRKVYSIMGRAPVAYSVACRTREERVEGSIPGPGSSVVSVHFFITNGRGFDPR